VYSVKYGGMFELFPFQLQLDQLSIIRSEPSGCKIFFLYMAYNSKMLRYLQRYFKIGAYFKPAILFFCHFRKNRF